ncbi:hypothetical protein NBRC10512_004026 [Rhodotorula toruloides]|uniref:RHTO0S03e08746g1_1 n=2 Tax=Rhodotorula toruloides TaxID=5286 RepID=A0A061ALE1_RHOTO|nr:uncharacterized protein RHTO_00420 [Rhodotorula toruloides NP11]EMS25992.1 hypothetical protein RHTO_00420 [Rhodotorula toruloides NP11]CDR38369.1 RHTO0S03e08746g1_1 [Rhodotorula toruloides]
MPWRPNVFKSKKDKKSGGESSAGDRRPGTRGGEPGFSHKAEATGYCPQSNLDVHPGTRVWLPEEIEERNHPGRRLIIPESPADEEPSQQQMDR